MIAYAPKPPHRIEADQCTEALVRAGHEVQVPQVALAMTLTARTAISSAYDAIKALVVERAARAGAEQVQLISATGNVLATWTVPRELLR